MYPVSPLLIISTMLNIPNFTMNIDSMFVILFLKNDHLFIVSYASRAVVFNYAKWYFDKILPNVAAPLNSFSII